MSMIELHRLMLRDQVRNEAYKKAIFAAIRPGDTVIDLGSGTGVLAMWCAQAGAKRVHAIEAADIAPLTKQLVKDNRLDKVIKVWPVPSTEVAFPDRADWIVTETFGSHPFEENTYEFVRDALQRLCKPSAKVLPAAVSSYIALGSFEERRKDWDLFSEPLLGLDLSRLAPLTRGLMYAERCDALSELLSAPVQLERVSFTERVASKRSLRASLLAGADGVVSGLVHWFEAELVPSVILSSAPTAPSTHWRQIFMPLDAPLLVRKGDALEATIELDTRLEVGIRIRWRVDFRGEVQPLNGHGAKTPGKKAR